GTPEKVYGQKCEEAAAPGAVNERDKTKGEDDECREHREPRAPLPEERAPTGRNRGDVQLAPSFVDGGRGVGAAHLPKKQALGAPVKISVDHEPDRCGGDRQEALVPLGAGEEKRGNRECQI